MRIEPQVTSIRMMLGFFAGFIGVLIFQQPVLALLYGLGIAVRAPYSGDMTMPMGLPYVWSMAFWGGVWGVVLGAIDERFPAGVRFWETVALFGAVVPTAFAWITVLAMTHHPFGGHLTVGVLLTPFIINAVWGVGTEGLLAGLSLARRTKAS